MEEKELGSDAKEALGKMGELMAATNESYKELIAINDYLNQTVKVYAETIKNLIEVQLNDVEDQDKINDILLKWSQELEKIKPYKEAQNGASSDKDH